MIPHAVHGADDWLPTAPEDLSLKDNPKQLGGDAMVLYREVNVNAKDSTVNNYIRIKVFTAAGVKQEADIEIPYDKNEESIQAVRGRTIHGDGSIVEFDGKAFDKEIVKGNGVKYLAKTFTLPDVQPGSIVEYRFREQYDDRYYQNIEWVIQHSLYTRLAKFSIKMDDSSHALPLAFRTYALPTNVVPQAQKDGSYALEIHDLAGIEDEPLMPPAAALRAKVEFYYRGADDPSNETPEQYWKRMGKKWNGWVEEFVNKKKDLAADVSQNVASSDTPEEKLRKLYARVLKIRNLDFENDKTRKEEKQEKIKPNSNVADVLKHGFGHSLDINFLFIGLVRAAGFEAADVRVSSRNHTYFYPQREAASDLNSELVWVRAGSKEYYLDPSTRYYAFDQLPWFEAAVNGVRLSKEGSEMIMTPGLATTDATIVRHADLKMGANGDISGTVVVDFKGQEAAARRTERRDEDEEGRKKALQDEIKNWLPGSSTFEVTKVSNWDDVEQPVHVEGNIHVLALSSNIAQRRMAPVEIFHTTEVTSFQSQKRVNEINFPHPYENSDDLVIHLPAGYKVQGVPAAQNVNPGPVAYEISTTQQGDSVEVKRRLVIKGIRYPKESYLALRDFFSLVKTSDNAQFMLQAVPAGKSN
ncbi:MAG: DUF3857 and transglutaminase domain-containing protein [Acidobacteriia bacterium]|nr:DUF3857 and transglutaminase domain-containing protein [Terriglobia bacterium]